MTQYSVLGRLKLMLELDEDGAMEALPFCAAAMGQLLPQIKPGHKNDPRLEQAAAAMACCMLLQRGQGGERDAGEDGFGDIASFKAGDITVTKQRDGASPKERMAAAERARKAAMEDIRGLLKDTGFYAGQVCFKTPPDPAGQPPLKKGAGKRGAKNER